MKTLKKFLVLIIAMIISILAFSGVNKTNAEPGGPIYLGLVSLRSSGYGYTQGGKKVWKIAKYNSPSGGTADLSQMIYCIKAGPGFGSSDMSTGGAVKISTYNQKFNLKDLSSIGSPYRDVLPTGQNYNKLMWVLDHMYIINNYQDETAKNNFLKSVIPEERYSLLTVDEVDVIQQLAIWYFTNPSGEYHYNDIELYRNRLVNEDSDYKNFEDLLGDDGWDKQDAASALYDYYIDNASGSYVSPNVSGNPISLDDSRASMETSGSYIVAGPYRIEELADINYELTATYTNQDHQTISPRLGVKNSSGNIVTTSQSLKDLVGQDFYIMVSNSTNVTGINMTINVSYTDREITYWSVANAPNTEQPVVIVTEEDHNTKIDTSISVKQGNYNLKLIKIDGNSSKALDGAEFSVKINNGTAQTYKTDNSGSIIINNIPITGAGTDTITITETKAPDGYNAIIGTITVNVTKSLTGGSYTVTDAKLTGTTNGSTINFSGNTITVTIPNEKVEGSYDLQLVKKDDDTGATLQGAVFSVKINNGQARNYTTNSSGIISIDDIEITEPGTDTITIEEVTPPNGYNAMSGTIIVEVTKSLSAGSYIASSVKFSENSQGNGTEVTLRGGVVTITIPNKKPEGSYNLQIVKKDKDTDESLQGAVFSVKINDEQAKNYTTNGSGIISISDIKITEVGTDKITIEEITPPTGYNLSVETLVIEVTKTVSGGQFVASGVKFAEGSNGEAHVNLQNGLITVTVPNEKMTGLYNLQLIKKDSNTDANLAGAKFEVTINDGETKEYTTDNNGSITIDNIAITEAGIDKIVIEETQAPEGYNKIIGTLTVNVTKINNGDSYTVTRAQFANGTNSNGSTVTLNGNTIVVTVPNKKIEGTYKLQLIKKDSANNTALSNATFSVKVNNSDLGSYTTSTDGRVETDSISITEPGTDKIVIEETQAPEGYNKIIEELNINVEKTEQAGQYVVTNAEFAQGTNTYGSTVELQGNTIIVTVPNEKQEGSYNLQLIKVDGLSKEVLSGAKFTVQVNGGQVQEYTTDQDGKFSIPSIDITEVGTDTIIINETTPPVGYNKIIGQLEITVTKVLSDGEYVVSKAEFTQNTQAQGSTVDLSGNTITVTVPNEKQTGGYGIQLIKQDRDNKNPLSGAKFDISINNGVATEYTTDSTGIIRIDNIPITETGIDTITITETEAPIGYNKIIDTLTIEVEKILSNGEYTVSNATFAEETHPQGSTVQLYNNLITITVPNEKQTGSYNLQLIKTDLKDSSKVLQGAKFTVKINNGTATEYITNEQGLITIGNIQITETGTDTIEIEEIEAPAGYNKVIGTLKLEVEKTIEDGEYIASNVTFTDDSNTNGSTVNLSNNLITVTVPNGYFDLSLRKFITGVNDEQITNREPQVNVSPLIDGSSTTAIYNHTKEPVSVALGDTVIYTIRVYNEGQMDGYAEEITDHLPAQLEFLPEHEINTQYRWVQDENDPRTIRTDYLAQSNEQNAGDNKLTAFNGSTLDYRDVQVACKVVQTDPMPNKITNIADITDFTDGDGNKVTDRDSQEDNVQLPTDENLPNYKDDEIDQSYVPGQQDDDDFEKLMLKEFDLSLRKFITGVNNEQITNRVPQVDVTPLVNGSSTTAIYNHTKQPVSVALGDVVIYTIRVYNEGQVDGYVNEITDHLPAQLEFLPDHSINQQYRWVQDENDPRTIRTDYLSKANEQTENANKILAFNGQELDYRDVQVACKVVQTDPMPNKITNIADITDFTDGNGNKVPDRDSEEDNVQLPSDEDLPGYKDDELDKDYIPGQQDDDDFEKLILKEFDLSLRKFITKVNDNVITNRIPQVDVTPLVNGTGTTAIYNHTKEPVKVTIGSVVEYTIRVYNEGQVDGYATEIKDHIPAQLEFLPENATNQEYRWVMLDANGNVTQNVEEAVAIRTDYLSKENEQTEGENKLEAFNGSILDYRDVKVAFRVKQTDPMPDRITNIADISDYTDEDGNKVPDRDSEEDNVEIPSDEDLPNYKDDEIDQDYVPGQQDDDDFEKVEIAEFDLSLRKFITAVNDSEITNRIPQVDVTPLIDGSGTTAIYNHPKDPVLVSNGNIVTYTIRVYNEGEVAGYASRIKDDIPEGLEFLPDNEINQEYRWVMLDENGNVTENLDEAVALETDYLSKEQEQEEGENLISAFDGEELDYRDVKIAFKVIEPNTSDRILINKAQISEDTDENGNDVVDRDSIPDEWNEGEDDQDIEKVKVQYFDLSLRKWVTQAIVNKKGEETVIETGHKAEDDPEEIVAVDLKDSEIATTTVKFKYSIRVTNEGTIAGYAKEIKDYIPDGLIFVPEDNPEWTQNEDGTIVTTQAQDILLEPGQSTEVEVILTWDKEKQNFGVMDNWAEISKDYNDFGSPDIDSTPNNNKHGEDDIDDAPVLVSVKTGEVQIYLLTSLSVLGILGTGFMLIKKFVL